MELPNSDIPGLPPITSLPPGGLVALWDPIQGFTGSFDISTLVSSTSADFRWISTFAYSQGELVTYNDKIWESLTPGSGTNQGNIPQEGPGFWTERSKSKSGFVLWAAGVFTETDVYVLFSIDGFLQFFRLVDPTRPYNSTNFLSEWAAGKWELMSERTYLAINKTAHGWTANDTLITFKAGAWNTWGPADRVLGIVKTVVDANNAVASLTGARVKGFVGLTTGQIYYGQPSGSLGISVTTNAVFIAISTTEVILLSSGGSATSPFVGVFVSLAALQTAYPSPDDGSYAFVDAGVGTDAKLYIWDSNDDTWILGGSSPQPNASPTVRGIAKLYNDLSASNTDGAVTQAAIKTAIDLKFTTVDASPTVKGISKLYATLGQNTDGPITQKGISDALLTVETFVVALKFDTNYVGSLTITGANAFTFNNTNAAIGKTRKIYMRANGINKPTFSSDFVIQRDNWLNTLNVWNVIHMEYTASGKVSVWITYQ